MLFRSEMNGTAHYVDLTDGVSVREVTDDTTGISSREVVDWKAAAGGANLRPRITLRDEKGEVLTLANGLEARYFLSAGAILSIENGAQVQAGDVLARIPRESSKTRDITGGLPRVAELFEARRPKEAAEMAKIDGIVSLDGTVRGKKKLLVTDPETDQEEAHLIPHGKHLVVQVGDLVHRGQHLTEGGADPHEVLDILGPSAVQDYLIAEIQKVYRLQGVTINDKHIEVIISQMLKKVRITDPGDSDFFWGEQVDRFTFMSANEHIEDAGGMPAEGEPVLLGITKASLETESFISAASFQETTRVLTDASTLGKVDSLKGFKENVIMGHLIPAGTGLPVYRNLRIDTLGAEVEKLSPEEAAKLVEGVSIPAPEPTEEVVAPAPEATAEAEAATAENAEGEEAS